MKRLLYILILCFLCLISTSCQDKSKIITVGATSVPHAQILEQCRDLVEEQGFKLKIVKYENYSLLNPALSDGSLDANFFQHKPYLDAYNEEKNADLVHVISVHYEPLGLYAGKSNDYNNIKQGATIGIPNDTTNCARALLLLEELGLITLDSSKGVLSTVKDITSNPYNLEIVELAAALIPRQLIGLDFGVINGNYALNANILDKLLISENKESLAAKTYANVLVVRSKDIDNIKTKVLADALSSDKIKDFINNTYYGSVVSVK